MISRCAGLLLLSIVPAWSFDANDLAPSPGLTYSTFLRGGFKPAAIATDSAGNVYLAGSLLVDPLTRQSAALVVKLNPQGTEYVYARTFGGTQNDFATAIAVDSAGNAYVAGAASSPDFPAARGPQSSTPASGPTDARTFLIKLDAQGFVLFSELLGGSVNNAGAAVAIAASGEIVVSGSANSGFPVTSGAYKFDGPAAVRPYVLKLDSSGTTVRFSAYGIGGNALATDSAGNIFMAGSTLLRDYPTTPDSYQPILKPVLICFGFCQIAFPATNQYLTKIDPAGAKLIYSTGVAGGGQTENHGLAVDAAGNAYLTGLAFGAYPYTVNDPQRPQVRPLLTKLDAAGKNALYSVPIGGAGVALNARGDVFVGGTYDNRNLGVGLPNPLPLPSPPPSVTALPAQCRENSVTSFSQAYASRIEPGSGNVLATVLADASYLIATGIAVAADQTVWIAGATGQPDVPLTAGALFPSSLTPGILPGAYLGQADFSLRSPAGAPEIACLLDAATMTRTGPVAANQILTIVGNNLGPSQGVAAADSSTTSLAGVSVMFGDFPGNLLYVSSSQINVAVPFSIGILPSTAMRVTVSSLASPPRALAVTSTAPSLFASLSDSYQTCTPQPGTAVPSIFVPVVRNEDGAFNSCDHPAKRGSVISLFLNGVGGQLNGNGGIMPWLASQIRVLVQINARSAEVVKVAADNDFVWRVDVRLPADVRGPGDVVPTAPTLAGIALYLNTFVNTVPVGPLTLASFDDGGSRSSVPWPLYFWVAP